MVCVRGGFSLVEVLVSLVILSLGITFLWKFMEVENRMEASEREYAENAVSAIRYVEKNIRKPVYCGDTGFALENALQVVFRTIPSNESLVLLNVSGANFKLERILRCDADLR